MFDIRNVLPAPAGGFDLEVRHPTHGWIPFTAREDDPEAHGRTIYAQAKRLFEQQLAAQ